MEEKTFRDILDRYLKGAATAEEAEALEAFFESYRKEGNNWPHEIMGAPEQAEKEILDAIAEKYASTSPSEQNSRWVSAALKIAATLLLLAGAGIGVYVLDFRQTPGPVVSTLAPGADKAILRLADGSEIQLDSAGAPTIPRQGDVTAISGDGMISYKAQQKPEEILYNTMLTPRGGQYEVALADGTKVWLNSLSSLRYPVAFSGTEREVELTGEAYFEVAKDPAMPFIVRIASFPGDTPAEIRVMGTHFNVMAYRDEKAVATTLLEGSVRVVKGDVSGMLAPGEQAQLSGDGKLAIIKDYDVSQAIAWKNGTFAFNDTPLEEIMRQIARWYDVKVAFHDDVQSLQFGGVISRRENASAVLDLLELTGEVKFDVNGRNIVVRRGK